MRKVTVLRMRKRYAQTVLTFRITYILYTVSTQQHQYSDIMYAIGYTVATYFDHKQSPSGQ